MGSVFPHFWKNVRDKQTDAHIFHKKIDELIREFSKHADYNGQPIEGILDLILKNNVDNLHHV